MVFPLMCITTLMKVSVHCPSDSNNILWYAWIHSDKHILSLEYGFPNNVWYDTKQLYYIIIVSTHMQGEPISSC